MPRGSKKRDTDDQRRQGRRIEDRGKELGMSDQLGPAIVNKPGVGRAKASRGRGKNKIAPSPRKAGTTTVRGSAASRRTKTSARSTRSGSRAQQPKAGRTSGRARR